MRQQTPLLHSCMLFCSAASDTKPLSYTIVAIVQPICSSRSKIWKDKTVLFFFSVLHYEFKSKIMFMLITIFLTTIMGKINTFCPGFCFLINTHCCLWKFRRIRILQVPKHCLQSESLAIQTIPTWNNPDKSQSTLSVTL